MHVTSLDVAATESMTHIVRENAWKMFCRGIFIAGRQLADDAMEGLFSELPLEPDLCLGAFDGTQLKGFLIARPVETRLEIFLLEATRDASHAKTIEALLAEIHIRGRQRAAEELAIRPYPTLCSTVNLKDDAMLDVLFKMGFWQDVTLAAEMRISLNNYCVPQKVHPREVQLTNQGFSIRPCSQADLDALDRMCSWREATGFAWGKLLRDVITETDPGFIILAMKDGEVVGYSTFFARTIMNDLPEYGPVFVNKELRGQGLASVMLSKSLTQIVELGKAKQVQLSCYPNKFPIYSREGFFFTDKYLFHATSRPTEI